ncbi:Zinc finger, GRF-type [Sesbania bispinosa]|nr:Zinc finger, GRF-type [Sesbania bispinosa]
MMGGGGLQQRGVRQSKKPSTSSWSGSATSMDSPSARLGHGSNVCYCGNKAIMRTSKTKKNPGRPFCTCALPKESELNCNFFEWADGVGLGDEIAAVDRGRDLWNKTGSLAKIDNLLIEVRIVKGYVFGIGCVMN